MSFSDVTFEFDDGVGHCIIDLSYTLNHSSYNSNHQEQGRMTTASLQGSSSTAIQTYHTYIPSPLPTAPSFDLHLTRFRDTLLIWVGTSAPSDGSALAEEQEDKRIAADWSVAMPSNRVCPPLKSGRRIWAHG